MAQTDNSGAKEQSAPLVGAKERFDRIYNTIRDQICLLEYAPGTRLSEEELAKQFDTSRTPVRRVLARLEAEGLVASVHGVGTIVTDPDLDEIFQIYRLRLELAELVGKLDPLPRTPDDLDRIRALIKRCDDEMQEPSQRAFLRLNMDFYWEISAFTGNAALREVNERLYLKIVRVVLKMMPKLGLVEEYRAFREEMQAVLNAAEIGDWEAIGYIRRAHLSMSYNRIKNYAR
ncbi:MULTISPECIES: GntR family transcriptional regulator [unclassified Shinella]|uniref:GntR family transcriptional regulator n=1 Tax=unclassified Shinella TaxID=2643062 RepID=UPI00225D1421|nr:MULTISPECIES: GntR family transcriptional regulator [unclassified Shinella]CAI0335330.1 GntR family transcriptional regulator [Rhizobiaceae bacterium]CAK7259640.1 GntR family transcriptional regulator [Shinella sp. WSC3-e]MCO5137802.1 GntR family transcriptional regulator [Shinella sp.]MCW5707842.1 GntR family transcriptional regulator [Shinella sp.]MDC7257919.1 GntR family transcriptional regulator [Shinella sp. YE25]